MLLYMYQIFSSLQGHLHFCVHFLFIFMEQFFLGHPISSHFESFLTDRFLHSHIHWFIHSLDLVAFMIYPFFHSHCIRFPRCFLFGFASCSFLLLFYSPGTRVQLNPIIAYFKGLVKIILYIEVLFIANI